MELRIEKCYNKKGEEISKDYKPQKFLELSEIIGRINLQNTTEKS